MQDTLQDEINSLSFMPERIRVVDAQPWKEKGVRKIQVKNYYIYFVISEPNKTVEILVVIYAGRDQQQALNASVRISDGES